MTRPLTLRLVPRPRLRMSDAPRAALTCRVLPVFGSAAVAQDAATRAAASEAAAQISAAAASVSEGAAAVSATSSAGSANAAATSASAAAGSAATATTKASEAAASASTASTKAGEAAASASAAAGSAATATTKASEAAASASTASTKAGEAAASASAAAGSAANAAATLAGAVRHDIAQTLTAPARAQARTNIGMPALGLGFVNRVINGNCAINQRGVSGTVTLAAGAYGHDRWRAGAGGCTYTFAASGIDTVITITSGTLRQVIEGLFIEGGVYTASWSGTAQARIYQGAASGAYASGPITTGNLAAATNTTIEFSAGTLTRVQVEPGTVATAYERRDDELRRCQRYFVASIDSTTLQSYAPGAGFNTYASHYLPVPMRAVPTLSATWTSHVNATAGGVAMVSERVARAYNVSSGAGGYVSTVRWDSFDAEL